MTYQVQEIDIKKIKRNPKNPRFIEDSSFEKLVESVTKFPNMLKIRPVVLNKKMMPIGGNMRYLAALKAGFKTIRVINRKGTKIIYHFNRTVIHPDFIGLGLGIMLINETSRIMKRNQNCRIMGKFSSIPVFKAMIKQPCWKFLGEKRLMGKMQKGGTMDRQSGFREGGIRTFNFEYHG